MKVRKLSPSIGVEVTQVDVRGLSDSQFEQIYAAWVDSGVMVVRDQNLTIEEFLHYSRRFGVLHPHPSKSTRHPDYPELTMLGTDKFDAKGQLKTAVYRRGADNWHTDGAYDQIPFKATQLYARAIPDRGGDTLFASMYAAYEDLPDSLKQQLAPLKGGFTYGGRSQSTALLNPEDRNLPPVLHPLARKHEETGRLALYFDPGKIVNVTGLDPAQSEALIEELDQRMVDPSKVYRHQWQVGDIVIWDNRCTYHRAAADYPPEQDRIHWRVSIKALETASSEAQ